MKSLFAYFLSAVGAVASAHYVNIENLPAASTVNSGDVPALYHDTGSAYPAQRLPPGPLALQSSFVQSSQAAAVSNAAKNLQASLLQYNAYPMLLAGWDASYFQGHTNGATFSYYWPDITGNFFLTEVTGAATYAANAVGENGAVSFTNTGRGQLFVCSNLPTAGMLTNCTIVVVAQDTLEDGSPRTAVQFSGGNTGNNGNLDFYTFFGQGGGAQQNAGGSWGIGITNGIHGYPQTMGNHAWDICIVRFSPASGDSVNEQVWMNGKIANNTMVTAGGIGGGNFPISGGDGVTGNLYLGGTPNSGGFAWQGNIALVLLYATNEADDCIAALNTGLEIRFQKAGRDLTLLGASVTQGDGSLLHSNNCEILHRLLPNWNINNESVAGIGTGAEYTNYLSTANDNASEEEEHIYYVGVDPVYNDVQWLSLPLSQSETNLINLCAAIHQHHGKVVLGSPFSARLWETNSAMTYSNLYAWELARWTNLADGFADYTKDPLVGPCGSFNNSTVYPDQDGVHVGALGLYSMDANELVPAIQSAIEGKGD